MKKFTIAGIGELLWDVLPNEETLGGAPVNFAYHINALGAIGIPISTVGDDDRGHKACEALAGKGVNTSAISVNQPYPTGYVDVLLNDAGIASYRFPNDVAWDHLEINDVARELQKELDAICFGTLVQRSDQAQRVVQNYLSGLDSNTLKIYDVNLRQRFYSANVIEESLTQANIVKLNDEELTILANLLNIGTEESTVLQTLLNQFSLEMVILTRGADGSLLMTPRQVSELRGAKTTVVDTIGAGDSFTAAVAIGYLQKRPLEDIHAKADTLAAYVCSRRGAMVEVPTSLAMFG